MTIEQQCLTIYKIDSLVRRKLLTSKFKIVQALGAFAINFTMGFCYATVLQIGQKEYVKRSKKNGR